MVKGGCRDELIKRGGWMGDWSERWSEGWVVVERGMEG